MLRECPALGDYSQSVATTWPMNIQQVHEVTHLRFLFSVCLLVVSTTYNAA